jgi:hypothetical protein
MNDVAHHCEYCCKPLGFGVTAILRTTENGRRVLCFDCAGYTPKQVEKLERVTVITDGVE